jgi:hypothetical protein
MAVTYDSIATTTLGSNTGTITFNSISQSYTDLILIFSGRLASASATSKCRINNDAGTNYFQVNAGGNGVSTAGSIQSSVDGFRLGEVIAGLTNTQQTLIMNFNNYSSGSMRKMCNWRVSSITGEVGWYTGIYNSNSAITRLDLVEPVRTWATGTTVTLYGILKA